MTVTFSALAEAVGGTMSTKSKAESLQLVATMRYGSTCAFGYPEMKGAASGKTRFLYKLVHYIHIH